MVDIGLIVSSPWGSCRRHNMGLGQWLRSLVASGCMTKHRHDTFVRTLSAPGASAGPIANCRRVWVYPFISLFIRTTADDIPKNLGWCRMLLLRMLVLAPIVGDINFVARSSSPSIGRNLHRANIDAPTIYRASSSGPTYLYHCTRGE
jgi:hypothetical protein